jgi:mannose-6-phosphate isomerase-like protein (cupin superfamily)
MPQLIEQPTQIEAPGEPPKIIREHVGRVNTTEDRVSIAHMTSPSGWGEPFQTPEFDEWTLVLAGEVRVEHDGGVLDVAAGQTVLVKAGERVRYSSPGPDGADYVAVCLPAFSPDTVGREDEG